MGFCRSVGFESLSPCLAILSGQYYTRARRLLGTEVRRFCVKDTSHKELHIFLNRGGPFGMVVLSKTEAEQHEDVRSTRRKP